LGKQRDLLNEEQYIKCCFSEGKISINELIYADFGLATFNNERKRPMFEFDCLRTHLEVRNENRM
jgi:hypothetical protein